MKIERYAVAALGSARQGMKRLHLLGEWAATWSARVALRLYAAAHQVGQRVQSVRRTLIHFGHVVKTGHSRLQEVLRQQETELAKVIADSTQLVQARTMKIERYAVATLGSVRQTMKRLQLLGEWAATWSARVALRLYAAAHRLGQRVQSVCRAFIHFGHVVKTGRSRLQEVLRKQETELAKILIDSTEPVVVTDDAHRILAANAAALTLFGVSEANLYRFAIDAFLPSEQVHYFERNGPRFGRSAERVGECEIRPLVGKPKMVEFSFQ
jgi:PAS domain-containing protein